MYVVVLTVNIALNKPAYQSRIWHDEDAQNAVNGRKSGTGAECSKTYGNQNATWWVNLTSIHRIHHIIIYYMKYYGNWCKANTLNLFVHIFILALKNS